MPSPTPSLSPVRIYVLWHPALDNRDEFKGRDPKKISDEEKDRFNRGLKLARRIYHWFRMENMDGIPVYFRSTPSPDQGGLLPDEIKPEPDVRNYIIPLVNADMVSCPEWRRYVSDLAERDDDASKSLRADPLSACGGRADTGQDPPPPRDCRIFPVAIDSVAYNMPERLRKLNYLRHVATDAQAPLDDAVLLAKLTEVLCRDLRFWLLRETHERIDGPVSSGQLPPIPAKIRIFLSHAKADDTDEALAIKEHIQRNTQCEAFFDETDIASGFDYTQILESAVKNESAGLIVVQGDNYADRPWCRKEIRDFLRPISDPLADGEAHFQFFIPPVVVVQTMKGKQIARTIPELGYSPCVRWNGNAAGFVVATLLREILFGLFYRILADRIATSGSAGHEVFINRAPDPVMVSRMLKELCDRSENVPERPVFIHPGYGLSKIEMDGLLAAVRGIRFQSFLARTAEGAPLPHDSSALSTHPCDTALTGKIIAVSAGTPCDIPAFGQSDEHMAELLTRLLRPIVAAGASLLYGGSPPKNFRPVDPWNDSINFTALLLSLLLSERETSGSHQGHGPRLYLSVPWHERQNINSQVIAQWLDICSFIFVSAEETGIEPNDLPTKPTPLSAEDLEMLDLAAKRDERKNYDEKLKTHENVQAAVAAVSLTAMRQKICEGTLHTRRYDSTGGDIAVTTFAHILIGGAKTNFRGVMPGIYEEALYAIGCSKPLFIIGACGGAAAALAKRLLILARRGKPGPQPVPPEFTAKFYEKQHPFEKMLLGIKNRAITCNPNDSFKELWSTLCKVHDPASLAKLMNNGLSGDDNIRLLEARAFGEVADLVLKAIHELATEK